MDETRIEEQHPGSTTADRSLGALLADFDQHWEGRHGCAEGTRKNDQREAKTFFLCVFPTQSIDWRELTAGKVADYVDSRAKKLSIVSRQNPAIAIRRHSRHTTAMHLLQSGVDITVIALWLGHESLETTHGYVEAVLQMKEQALGKLAPVGGVLSRFKPDDALLAYLPAL